MPPDQWHDRFVQFDFRDNQGRGATGIPSSIKRRASCGVASPTMARSGASPSWIARASLANSRPTFSEVDSIFWRNSRNACSAGEAGSLSGLGFWVRVSPTVRPDCIVGAIIAFSTLLLPQTEQLTKCAPTSFSNASADWNQLSKLWVLSHFRVYLIMIRSRKRLIDFKYRHLQRNQQGCFANKA